MTALFNFLTAGPDNGTVREESYSFADLSPRAKEHARDEYRASGLDYAWWDSIYEDAITVARKMGIDVEHDARRTTHGNVVYSAAIYFSGFCSQGDGACFAGDWTPVRDPLASLSAIMDHVPTDAELHEIAFALAHMSERCNALIPDAVVRVTRGSSSYCHENTVQFDADLPTPDNVDLGHGFQLMVWNALVVKHGLVVEDFEREAADVLRRFMRWIYRQLEDEHDHLTSDQYVDEQLSDFSFDIDGDMIG